MELNNSTEFHRAVRYTFDEVGKRLARDLLETTLESRRKRNGEDLDSKRIIEKADQILMRIQEAPPTTISDQFIMLKYVGSRFRSIDDWEYITRFLVFSKIDFDRCQNIPQFDPEPLYTSSIIQMIKNMSKEQLLRLALLKMPITPITIDWNDMTFLLSIELGGDACFSPVFGSQFIELLIEKDLDQERFHHQTNPPDVILPDFVDESWYTKEELFHYLFNKLSLIVEIRKVYVQLFSH